MTVYCFMLLLISLSEIVNVDRFLLNEIRSVKIIFNRNESIIVALHPLSFPTPGAHRFAYFRSRSPAWLNVSPNFKRGFF